MCGETRELDPNFYAPHDKTDGAMLSCLDLSEIIPPSFFKSEIDMCVYRYAISPLIGSDTSDSALYLDLSTKFYISRKCITGDSYLGWKMYV